MALQLTTCPACGTVILPTADNKCPNCGASLTLGAFEGKHVAHHQATTEQDTVNASGRSYLLSALVVICIAVVVCSYQFYKISQLPEVGPPINVARIEEQAHQDEVREYFTRVSQSGDNAKAPAKHPTEEYFRKVADAREREQKRRELSIDVERSRKKAADRIMTYLQYSVIIVVFSLWRVHKLRSRVGAA